MTRQLRGYHCLILDASGGTVFKNIPQECAGCLSSCTSGSELVSGGVPAQTRRRGRQKNANGEVFLCTPDREAVRSSKYFKRELSFYLEVLDKIGNIREELIHQEIARIRRLVHNLISLNAHSLQDLYSVIPQEDLSEFSRKQFKTQRDLIRASLIKDPFAAADLFIRTLKNEAAVKTELSVFRRLYDGSTKLNKALHRIHRVILNVANYFFQDLSEKGVTLHIRDCAQEVYIDYDSIQVVLFHLFDNAAKYTRPSTPIEIAFEQNRTVLIVNFSMTSYHVAPDEQARIFDEGFSGALPRKTNTAGQGLGMGLIRDLLSSNSASFSANWGEPLQNHGLPAYAHNVLSITFPVATGAQRPRRG